MRWTRGSLCAITERRSYWLAGSEASRMTFEDDKQAALLADATSWGKRCAELRIAKDGTVHVMADLGKGWLPQPIPDALQVAMQKDWAYFGPLPLRVAGDGDTIAFFARGWIYRLEGETWSRVALDLGEEEMVGSPTCAVLEGQELILGVHDHFGGQLIVANIRDGHARVESDSFPPGPSDVTDIALGPDGNLYVTCASPYMETGGRLLMRDVGRWRELLISPTTRTGMICGNAPYTPPPAAPITVAGIAASDRDQIPSVFPSTNFLALAFDEQRRPCVLCSALGIMRRESDGVWQCVTPGWYESGADSQDLVFEGRTAVLASQSAGVVLLDLDTLEGKRVRPR
jgi:hypothetical protein